MELHKLSFMHRHKNLGAILIVSGVLITVASTVAFGIIPNLMAPSTNLWLGDGIFQAKIALDDSARSNGVSWLTQLSNDRALVLAYPTDGLWEVSAKNINISLDVVWLDSTKKVIYIVKNILPDDSSSVAYKPKGLAKYVIILPAGTVDKKAININEFATIEIDPGAVK